MIQYSDANWTYQGVAEPMEEALESQGPIKVTNLCMEIGKIFTANRPGKEAPPNGHVRHLLYLKEICPRGK
jgi:hypothetical protein